jgi:serine protease
VCIPLGGFGQSTTWQEGFRRVADQNVIVVCPAGNNSNDVPVYPGAYPNCVTAAAVDAAGRLAEFSSFGDWVTTAAPGVQIPVAMGEDRYDKWAGTSFSCGILAGSVALMLNVNPSLTLERAKEILRSVGPPVVTGEGGLSPGHLRVLDTCAAVQAARASQPARPHPKRARKRAGKV